MNECCDAVVTLRLECDTRESAARFEPLFGKPTLVHFKHKPHRLGRAVRIGGLWLHVGQVHDGAVVGDEGRRQRQQGVFHPKALRAGLLEHKQHAFVLRHVATEHQAYAALLGGLGHLCVNLVHACLQLDAWQVGLRCVLRVDGQAERREKERKKNTFHKFKPRLGEGDAKQSLKCIARRAQAALWQASRIGANKYLTGAFS